MRHRIDLDHLLKEIFDKIHPGLLTQTKGDQIINEPHVYYQPPESIKINYPCIIYQRDAIDSEYADNRPYRHKKRYIITVVSRDPDDELPEEIGNIQSSSFDRRYVSDNLYHDVFSLFF